MQIDVDRISNANCTKVIACIRVRSPICHEEDDKGNTTIANDAKYTTVCAYIARKIFSSSILSRNRVHEVTNVGLTYAYMFAIANSEMREGRMRAN